MKAKVIGKISHRELQQQTHRKKWGRPLTVSVGAELQKALKNKKGGRK